MTRRYSVFCISSPLQAENARKAADFFQIPSGRISVLLFDHALGRDFERVKISLGWLFDKAQVIKIDYKTSSLLRRMKFLAREGKWSIFDVFVGDWNNKLPKFFALHPCFGHFYALDDGSASFAIARRVQRLSWFYKLAPRFKPIFVTRYAIEGLCPSFKVFRLPSSSHHREQEDVVVFIGCPVVEKNIVDSGCYSEVLAVAKKHFSSSRLLYYPHRHEKGLALPDGITEILPEVGIEEWFNSLEKSPRAIVSLFSTALFNIKADNPDVDAFFVRIFPEELKDRAVEIEGLYAELDQSAEFIELKRL